MKWLKQSAFFFVGIFLSQASLSQELITGDVKTDGHRIAHIGELVRIDSSQSDITGRSSFNHRWTLLSKPSASLAELFSSDESSVSFVPDRKGTYIVRLYIYSEGFISHHKDTIISVQSPEIRATAIAGEDISVAPGTLVELSADQSFHFEEDEALNYEWVLESFPEDSSAQIYFPQNKETAFYADIEGIYLVRLIVGSENSQRSLPAYKVVRVEGAETHSPAVDAGPDQLVLTGQDLTLTGSVTYTGTETLSYLWKIESFPSGSEPQLTHSQSLAPVFKTDTDGTYILSFQAQAGDIKGAPDFIRITSGQRPVALAVNSNIIGLVNQEIALDGSVSFDPNALDLNSAWSVSQKPNASSAQISDTSSFETSFSGDREGEYVLQLVVRNSHFSSLPKQVKVRLISPNSFKAEAGSHQVVPVGSVVSLSASSSLGSDLSYFWSLIEKPDLSHAELLHNHFVSAKLLLDNLGAYIFRLVVQKEGFLSEPDYVVFNAIMPSAQSNAFSETFNLATTNLSTPINDCNPIARSFNVNNPENKEFFILFESQGMDEFFVMLNGEALTGRLEHETNTFIYPVSLKERNSLSVRLRGHSADSLKVRIFEKSSSQTLPSPPVVMAGSIRVSLGGSRSTFITRQQDLTYSLLEEPLYGTATVSSSGELTYTSDGISSGEDFLLVRAENSEGLVSVAPIKVIIN
ncbi:MAG: hypothetical protein OXN83_04125 [Oligoflexia bacterium]|nr:hypothetical protein [Oligoflexia bacterium]